MKKTLTRGLALAMVLLTVLMLAAPALAASKTMIVNRTSLQVRSTASQSGDNVIGKLMRNELVTQTGTTGAWAIIEFNGSTAYVLSSGLADYRGPVNAPSAVYDPPVYEGGSSSGATVYTTGAVNVRSGPGTNYSKLGQLAKGATVTQVGTTGSWAIIDWNNGVAYVSLSYLTSAGSSSGSAGSSSSSRTLEARVNTTVRTGPGFSNRAIGYLDSGQRVGYIGSYGSWYRVAFGSYDTAYVYAPDMRFTSGSVSDDGYTSASGYVFANSTVSVYRSASTGSTRLGYLYAGQSAQRTGYSGSFTRINFEGSTGYVLTSAVDVSGYYPGINNSNVIGRYMYSKYNNARCYTSPVESGSYFHSTLRLYERVWAIEGNSTWTKITASGGDTVYTRTSNLTYAGGGGYYGPGYGYYGDRSVLAYRGAPVYYAREGDYQIDVIEGDMYVYVINYLTGSPRAEVYYYDGGEYVQGFIDKRDLAIS